MIEFMVSSVILFFVIGGVYGCVENGVDYGIVVVYE